MKKRSKIAYLNLAAIEPSTLAVSQLFDRLTDVRALENLAVRENVIIKHHGDRNGPLTNQSWAVKAAIRRKIRHFTININEVDAPNSITYGLVSDKYDVDIFVKLRSESPESTLLQVEIAANPRTITARLMLRSLNFSKHRLSRRLARGLRKVLRYAETGKF